MSWTVLAKLPHEDLKSDPTFNWAIEPTFYQVSEDSDEDEFKWTVNLLHRHWEDPLNPHTPPKMFHCGIVNRADITERKAFPEYQCDKCGNKVPKNVVEEKIERQRALKGIDPRNNRRGAVLATRNRNLNTKES